MQKVKEQRSHRMIEATLRTKEAFFRQQIGRTEPVLFEQEVEPGVFEGYTENYTPVRINSEKSLGGLILPVKISTAQKDFCTGEPA